MAGLFRWIWSGTAAANLADGVMIAAAPLLAVTLTRDPVLVSGLVVAQRLPWFAFTLLAGVVVDRMDRRLLLIAANMLRAGAVGILTVAVATGHPSLWLLYGVVFLMGTAETVADTSAVAVLPRIMPRERLEWANGRIFATQSVLNELVGPPLGGVLFAFAATAAFLTGSIAFAVAGALLALLPALRPAEQETPEKNVFGAIRSGLSWFWGNSLIRTVAIMAAIVNVFWAATTGVLVLVATSEMGLNATGYGLLLTAGAVGGITAGLMADRLVTRIGSGPVIFASNLLPALGYAIMTFTSEPMLAGAALALNSFSFTVGSVILITLRQAVVPDHLLGRVTSAYRLIALGALPVGGALGGGLAAWLGLRAPFALGAIVLAATAFVLLPRLTTDVIDEATGRADVSTSPT